MNYIIKHIKVTQGVGDVFNEDEIKDYVRTEFTTDELFDVDDMVEIVQRNKTPKEVFPESELADWANFNGWILPKEPK